MRGWLLGMLCCAGCQCLAPVVEGAGGGSPGGGGGPDGGCATASQCRGAQVAPVWCGTHPGAGYSCVQGACVLECPLGDAGRTCTVDLAGYCLRCADAGAVCPMTGTCGPMSGGGSVEPGSSCTTWPGTAVPFESVAMMRTASAACRFQVSRADGGLLLGDLWRLDDGEYLALFPGFGGFCTGRSAFTGAPRSIFTCPDCSFSLFGFE